ncbi:flagellar brake protein [Denitratisoma oestradiolicum]|uniref:Flagellar brake protein YcgR n=1 Tax=Denitratisoma oestradiolicum TaxID=311182 RepID=A0A6S6Y539_9PROT|nr:flagellar brake protein [Denitratisoma oestradiolicum]TWO81575.1 hypothetical protein CBW56_02340 [Denitratisoma oestradiolicum]CAB1370510.1 Flagellar brake protein YcgR [Denitratisoma oestradiolicum]
MNETPPLSSPESKESPSILLESGGFDRYMLHGRNEILYLLKSLIEHVCQITVFFGEKNLLLTSVIEVDENGLLLDYGASAEMNRKALEAAKLFCVTNLEKVKVQFILRGLTKVEYEGRPAFRADLPDSMLRLQRREYYRLTMPITRPLKCIIPIQPDDGFTDTVEVDVVDISGGGLSIVNLPERFLSEENTEIPNCRIDLPDVGVIAATLMVRTTFEIVLRSGTRMRRTGCEFVKLPGPMATLIQRYILKVERERKAREAGLT